MKVSQTTPNDETD